MVHFNQSRMNDSWIKQIISNFFANGTDVFGKESTYHGFEAIDPNPDSALTTPDGFQSVQLYGKILYKDEKNSCVKSIPIIIKSTPGSACSKFISFSFANEINFYSKMVPIMSTIDDSFSSLFPTFYHAEMMFSEKQSESAIVFENLKSRGFKLAEKKSFLDYQHLALMMRKLGQFHAYSYKAKSDNFVSRLFNPIAKSFQETSPIMNGEMQISIDVLQSTANRGLELLKKDAKYSPYISQIHSLVQNVDIIYKRALTADKENPILVLTHGDYLRNNVMFRYENDTPDDMLMIDMATCRYGSPVIDLVSVLYINADQATRNKYWDELIDEYYTALKKTFPDNQVPSKNAILSEFVGKSFYGYIVAAYFLPSLIADDYKIPYPPEMDPEICRKFDEFNFEEVPREMWMKLFLLVGGDLGTQALKDILQDMIDRGFICSQLK
ncbi:uncharacterized protein LOC135841157 [Planococcus citri]|uniref:uncharacterized protein LOC135841157 n=1 Tax=Planococcus citri TaxID=170843 RepID=UPI0031FA0EA2